MYLLDTSAATNASLPDSSPGNSLRFIVAFNVLYVTGTILLLAIFFFAYFSPAVRRRITWYMVLSAWIGIGLSNLMLLGKQTGPKPGEALCLTQAVLEYSLPTLFKLENACLVGIPTTILIVIIVEVSLIGILNPDQVMRHEQSGLYCHISDLRPQVRYPLIFIEFRRTSCNSKKMGKIQINVPGFSLNLFIRMVVLSALAGVILGVSFITVIEGSAEEVAKSNMSGILQATLPLLAALTLGTQRLEGMKDVRGPQRREAHPSQVASRMVEDAL
ncbi:hypothetical protein BDN70DRAFT_896124 [Pholiota conissans]|uniref:Uncharacterized protein n=1 Tax=Pholiota conissans TaxID=109636 RepID=A0A9P5Z1A1_9AGAR|nr:hypothetical protein BDN70DRAFT_896124 [Pholiota conissans]